MKGELRSGVYSYSDIPLLTSYGSHSYDLDAPAKACMMLAFMHHRHCSASSARTKVW